MKAHARKQSSANFSRLCLNSKSNASSSCNSTEKSEKISKYFKSPTKSEENAHNQHNLKENLQNTSNDESPYKSSLTDINSINVNTSLIEDNDFKTPTRISKRNVEKLKLTINPTNIVRKRGRKPKAATDNKTTKQMIFTKTRKENLKNTDVNEEHLQLAIALSRSLQDNHKRENIEDRDASSSSITTLYPNTQQKVENIKQTLEQFGLKSYTKKIEVLHKRVPVKKKRKYSEYQYVTPALLLRTEDDRTKLISEKVAFILSQNLEANVGCYKLEQYEEPISEKLRKNWNDDNRIFKLNNSELDILKNNDIFYVKSLNISPAQNKCGNLLKDWVKIPGRNKSPLRKHANEKPAINNEENHESDQYSTEKTFKVHNNTEDANSISTTEDDILSKTFRNNLQIKSVSYGSISPELFESDDEDVEIKGNISIPVYEEQNSQSLLNLTPQKSTAVHNFLHQSPNKEIANEETIHSQSLLKFTPTKKNESLNIDLLEKNNLENFITAPTVTNISKKSSFEVSNNKSPSSDLSEDNLFVNENGICTYECFSNEPTICYDLTNSSDEECNSEANDKKDIHTNVNQTVENITPFSEIQSCLSSGVSGIMQKSLNLTEENLNLSNDKEMPETSRQSKSLNITEYINNILNEEQVCVLNNSNQDELKPSSDPKIDQNDVFDLTQDSINSFESDESFNLATCKKEVNECEINNKFSPVKNNSPKFIKHDSFQSTTSDEVNQSQESICISDEELNYSSVHGTPYFKQMENFVYEDNFLYEIPDSCNMEVNNTELLTNDNCNDTPKTTKEPDVTDFPIMHNQKEFIDLPVQSSGETEVTNNSFDCNYAILQHPKLKYLNSTNTPTVIKSRKSLFRDSFNVSLKESPLYDEDQKFEAGPSNNTTQTKLEYQNETNTTPKGEMIIKTTNVTPIANYKNMDTPKIAKELQKFGIKPLKRQRGIQILKHIYESTHPVVGQTVQNNDISESDDDHRIIKRRKSNSKMKDTKNCCLTLSKQKSFTDDFSNEIELVETEDAMEYTDIRYKMSDEKIEIIGDLMGKDETVKDLIFERKHSKKVQSCRVPLHIAWHNLVSSKPDLRKNILLYEPLQLEVLYKLLKEQGYKYHIQDLLTFLDRKCITIRTNQNQHQNSRKKRKSVTPQKRK